MTLKNLRNIKDEIVEMKLSPPDWPAIEIDLKEAIVFPGLVNSHDHLNFNLFPQLGDKKYKNYTEWGSYIHSNYKKEIEEVLQVPVELRTQWGIYKNLLCGVTTVVNHGEKLSATNSIIHVHQPAQNLHSTKFEKLWKLKLNNIFKKEEDCILHIGEGIDELAQNEVDELLRSNWLNRKLIGVHGMSVTAETSKKFKALVWCPASNYFLFNETAKVNEWNTTLLFGTDSTLTADWNIWNHIRQARGLTSDLKIFNALTINASKVWQINSKGFVIAKKKSEKSLDSFFETNPEDILLIVCDGQVKLIDKSLEKYFPSQLLHQFSLIEIGKEVKFVWGNLHKLSEEIKTYYSSAQFSFTQAGLVNV